MASPDEPKGAQAPSDQPLSVDPHSGEEAEVARITHEPTTDNAYFSNDYTYGASQAGVPYQPALTPAAAAPSAPPAASGGRRLPPPSPPDETDEEDEGMLRMSFLEHLEELRRRLFYIVGALGGAFLLSMSFSSHLWKIVSAPAVDALTQLGIHPPNLTQLTPMEAFNVIWFKVPALCSVFIASPLVLYQVWAFVSPGLYRKERRWAVPFVLSTAGLFITGGLFAYFVAFRFGLVFLLGIGRGLDVSPLVSIDEYFNLFVNVTLGIAVVFELPILIFFLTLLRIVSPRFLVSNSRYAILIIVILAAVITPTPDVFNLMLFATPMILLFYLGILASYLLVLNREGKRFPWGKVLPFIGIALLILGGAAYYAALKYHYHFIHSWPFFSR